MPENSHNTPEAVDKEPVKNARYRLNISKDKLLVSIDITQTPDKGGQLLTARQISDDLKHLKVKHGINDVAIDSVITIVNQGRQPGYNQNSEIIALDPSEENDNPDDDAQVAPIIIAAGDAAKTGTDASLDWSIDVTRADLNIVLPGDLLAVYHPPQPGTPGKSVLGDSLRAREGIDTTPKPGAGIEQITTKDGVEYRARWYGHCHATETQLDVTCPLSVSADNMHATLDFYPPADTTKTLAPEHIEITLKALEITCGIDTSAIHQVLDRLAKEQQPIMNQLIAKGRPVVDGEDIRITWANALNNGSPGNYAIRPGFLIVTQHDARPGEPGYDIHGNTLPCNDKQAVTLEISGCIHEDPQTHEYTSTTAGTLSLKRNDDGYRINVDPHLLVSDDGLEASLDIALMTADGERLTNDDIRTTLAACGITFGIRDDLISEALHSSASAMRVSLPVAQGVAPRHGVDAHIHYLRKSEISGELLANGRIDFHEHNYPWTLKRGETIAYFIAAKEHADGTDVRGQTIPATPAKTLDLTLEGAHLDENNRIIADVDGTLIINGDNLSITDLLLIDGDVGPKTGNIHCDNDIHVKGYIKPGFSIQSGRTVIIEKNVEDASIICSGDVTIKGGIRGLKSEVFTPGSIHAGFIEHAQISVNGDITVAESVINSEISSNSVITVGSNRARHSAIIGGHTRAFKQIEANVLGSKSFHHTVVSVGFTQEMKQLQHDIKAVIAMHEHELEQLNQLEHFYQNHSHDEADEILRKTELTRDKLIRDIEPLQQRLDEIGNADETDRAISIIVHKKIYPGVTIKLDDHIFAVSQEMNGGTFILEDDKVIYKPELPQQGKARQRH